MQINGKGFYELITKRKTAPYSVGLKRLSLRSARLLAEDSLLLWDRIGAIHIYGFTKLIFHVLFYLLV